MSKTIQVNRRVIIVTIILLVAGVSVLGYFLHQSRKNLFTDPYKVISPDACIVIETIDFRSFINSITTGKGIFSEIEKITDLGNFNIKLKYVADQINKTALKKIIQEGTAIISFHPSADGKLSPFVSMAIPAEISYRQIREAFVASGVKKLTEQKLNKRHFIEISYVLNGVIDTVFISISSGLMVCSTSQQLVERSFPQGSGGTDIRNIPGFSKVLMSAGKNENKIFVVFSNWQKVMNNMLNPGAANLADKITRLGQCGGGDIFISDDGVSISGYTESSDPSDLLYHFRTIQPGEFQTYKILPSSTALFESLKMTFDSPGKEPEISVAPAINVLVKNIRPFLGEEITRAIVNIKGKPAGENIMVIYELKNRDRCEEIFIESMGKQITSSYFNPDDQTKIPVYLSSVKGLVSTLTPGFAPGFSDSHISFFDNYMVVGSSYTTISRFLYDNLLNRTLSNDILYREFEKTMPTRAGYMFYCVPSEIIDYLASFLDSKIINGLNENKVSLDKIRSVGFQLSSINGMIYNNLSVTYKDEVREESTTEWETLLDSTASIKPFFFTNHITGAKEIFIQDLKNNAYLINEAGRVLWKVPLKERITGTIYMIDYYKNGKYQLLFSGKNDLHILDRNGNYVERYPVRLRSPATNSLALFDYDNNKTYRLLIAGEDKMIYAYDKSGSVVKGWNPFRTAGIVTDEAHFYRVSGKDYIVIADQSSIYFLDRNGNVRLKPDDAVTKARNSALRLNTGSDPYLVCSAPDGTVQNIFFTGEVKKFRLKEFTFDHSFDFFDVDGDGFGEYVFIDQGTLYLYDHDRKEMFSREFSTGKLGGPISFNFSSSDKKIGVFDMNKKLIYLINSKGEVMSGFPLRGASMFSIGKLSSRNEWHLIVGGTDRFLYNYKLETSVK